jgi:DNA-binding IscR family transcriptional regulator
MFSDIPEVGKCYQQIPPNKLNPTERNVILLIVGHKNGCYIGEQALAQQVGTTVGNLRKVLGKLVKKGLVVKEQRFAHRGVRQCYRISVVALKELTGESLSVKTPLPSLPVSDEHKGSREAVKGIFESATAYPVEHPYRDNKNYKNDKDERFFLIIKDLPESVKALIEYAPNVSELLDELEHQGISLERIKGALEDTDFTNAYKVGGRFMSVLRGLRVSLAPIVEKPIEVFEPRKCDVCKSGCVFGNSLAEFEQGARCELATATEYRITKQRNGLEP